MTDPLLIARGDDIFDRSQLCVRRSRLRFLFPLLPPLPLPDLFREHDRVVGIEKEHHRAGRGQRELRGLGRILPVSLRASHEEVDAAGLEELRHHVLDAHAGILREDPRDVLDEER